MYKRLGAVFLFCMVLSGGCSSPQAAPRAVAGGETRYLAFQVFTGSPDPRAALGGQPVLGEPPSAARLDRFAADIVASIGSTGRGDHRLALVFGPVALDQSDAAVTALIDHAFDIALARDVAVGFHVDDSMFWSRRRALFASADDIERSDWDGPPSTGRRLDWGPQPTRAPPQLCINSPVVEAEVRRLGAEVIGRALARGIERVRQAGREDLFAGVIVGWETQIGRDFATGRALGYCALAHRGVPRTASQDQKDRARIDAVDHFISLWADAVAASGVPRTRIYSHIAFTPRRAFDATAGGDSYAERTNFSPVETAFGSGRRAGFSTYPQPGVMDDIHAETTQRGNAPWASAEGANVALGGDPTASGMSMETYLARLFNHGAVLVTIFGWGVGDDGNGFRRAAENPDALAAYRKFLRGEALVEGPVSPNIQERLPAKIHRIQAELPAWVERHNAQARVQPRVEALQRALAANDLVAAERAADSLLALLDE